MTINSDSTPGTTTGMEIIARDLPSYDDGLQDAASLTFGGAEDEEHLSSNQPKTLFALFNFNRTNKIICSVLGVTLLMIVTAFSSAAATSSNIVKSFNSPSGPKSSKAPKSSKQPKGSKQPKAKVVKVKGSSTPIGAAGKTGASGCLASPPSGQCCAEATGCYQPQLSFDNDKKECRDYLNCLRKKDNGPVLVGDWWLQRDVLYGEMFFEDDAVCGAISSTQLNSRTRFELWNDSELGEGLGLFNKFTVGYDFRSIGSGGSGGYLNFYIRASDNSDYYNCNFVYNIPNVVGTGTLEVLPDTVPNSVRASGSNTNGCDNTANPKPTILDYLTANPNAVMGVGNGELYTFVLNTGSTGQANNGKEVCWSNASVERYDDKGDIRVTTYEFTTL